jgi:3'-phosphoadenosine 5'-phosphosulfate sulfotransferase (PAPS reductase)/FAD synthetase
LVWGVRTTGQRFASIPAFTTLRDHEEREGKAPAGCEYGQTQRQCTKEYKIEVIEQAIRREVFGLKYRQRMAKDVTVTQIFGLSDDEPRRIKRVKANYAEHPWAKPRFPLAEMGWTREKCREYLQGRVPHVVPRSACVFCPYKSAIEWEHLKRTDPEGWARAVEIDRALRIPGNIVNRKFKQKMYLHRSCLPLEVIDLTKEAERERQKPRESDLFKWHCMEGMCGV